MNIFEGRLSQLKQELLPLLYLSLVQIWWNFNFPAFVRLGNPLSYIVSVSMSIISTLAFISVFLFPEKYAPSFNFEYLDAAPNASILKKIHSIWLIIVINFSMFFLWYKDFYGMSNTYYILCYTHWIITFVLIAQAIDRYNNKVK